MEGREWRELALTVPGNLMLIGTSDSEEALRLIDLANRKFTWRANVMRRVRNGARLSEIQDFVDEDPSRPSPPATVIADEARREISRCSDLHAEACRVFAHYTAHFGLRANQRCLSSHDRIADAVSYADEAMKRLLDAAAFCEVAEDAISTAADVPNWTPLWTGWMWAAEQLHNGAANECLQALDSVRLMRHALALQFFDSWMILNR